MDIGYIQKTIEAASNAYNRAENAAGIVNLAVAENVLSLPAVCAKLDATPPIPASQLTYDMMHGSPATRDALAAFLQTHVTKQTTAPDDLVVLNGCGAVADNLAMLLCDAGESMLLTGPGYRGLQFDLGARADVRVVIAHTDRGEAHRAPLVSVQALQRAYDAHDGEASPIRAVLICSPDNPTGQLLSASLITSLVQWARAHDLHIIFDEIFALSVHSTNADNADDGAVFRSVADVLHNDLRDNVHVMWGLSKDLCVSGMRVGVLYSQNRALLSTCQARLAFFSTTSRHTQWAVTHMLSDQPWVDGFLADNKLRIRAAYDHCTARLTALGVAFYEADAGFFVLADFRAFLPAATVQHELVLWNRMFDSGVLLTPSSQFFASRVGFFRICFAAADYHALDVGFDRIASVLRDTPILSN